MTKTRSSFILAIGWLIASIILLTLPGSAFPKENWLNKIWADKWIHVILFAVLIVLWCRATGRVSKNNSIKKYFIVIAILGIAYGIGMEFVQEYLVTSRSFDRGDIIADTAGCLAGLGFSLLRYIKK